MIESSATLSEAVTTDAFHNNAFKVLQPEASGHRSGMDALLLAASVPANSVGVLADFGAGVGVAGFAALNLNRNLDLLAVEKNHQMIDLAKRSVALNGNAFLKSRVRIIHADITASGKERSKVGLLPESVSHIIMNPPYNTAIHRPPQDSAKAEAFMIGEGGIDAWFRTAASMLKPGGSLTVIYRSENLGDILACTTGRFGNLQILPIHSKAGEPAKRIIARCKRSSRAPLSILPGFTVHQEDGSFTPQAQEIFQGRAHIPFGE